MRIEGVDHQPALRRGAAAHLDAEALAHRGPSAVAADEPVGCERESFAVRTPAAEQVVTYVGAGIYEEVLFRLGLFSAACFLLRMVAVPTLPAVLLAGVGAALTFAAAHHVGPSGEEMVPARFLFRTLAGLYFTALYVVRGFGVAVGAHAGYDVLVGVAVG